MTITLIDKGYYDYDFERVKENVKQMLYEDTVKSESETRSLLARFGIGRKHEKEKSLEEVQKIAMEQLNE